MTPARMRALLCGLCAAGTAWAQVGEAEIRRIEAMRARAVSSYDALEYDAARGGLEEALQAAAAAGLDRAPIAAKLHVTLGAVWVGGMRDRYRAFQEMLAAARIDPSVEIDPGLATLESQELLQSARDALAARHDDFTQAAQMGFPKSPRPRIVQQSLALRYRNRKPIRLIQGSCDLQW